MKKALPINNPHLQAIIFILWAGGLSYALFKPGSTNATLKSLILLCIFFFVIATVKYLIGLLLAGLAILITYIPSQIINLNKPLISLGALDNSQFTNILI